MRRFEADWLMAKANLVRGRATLVHSCLTVLNYRLRQQQGLAPNQDIAP